MKANNEDEREARIRELLPLVRTIARRVQRMVPAADFDDLVGDGSVGLIRAVDGFDPTRGTSLEKYARHVIGGTILNGLRRMDPVSERVRRNVRMAEKDRYRVAVERGAMPTSAEMEKLHPGFERAARAARCGTPLSLDVLLPEGERLSRDWSVDPAEIVAERDASARVWELLGVLPPRQRELMRAYYRSGGPLRVIADRMCISPQRASQLHVKAIARLKKHWHAAPH
jgi:RNA polymerase sigma factor for flagellar operon FliA